MSSALTWKHEGGRVRLAGRIDENADLAAFASDLPFDGATVDLGGLTRINSIGVREWMDFVGGLGSRKLRLVRCAPVFVEQLNAIANFAGTTDIVSVLSEFECESDGESTLIEVQVTDVRAGKFPHSPRCPKCSAEMIPAQENSLYYRFLRY